ncbi:hypothetical protein D3C73_1534380 [compost metagenome]
MPNEHIMPIYNVQRTIRSKLQVYRAEIRVVTHQQIHAETAFITCTVILQSMFFGSQKTNGIIDQEVALKFIRKMAAGYNFNA